ncbi:hypothetical protein N473_18150 [Pseudoalteromonas luteoviolacea CPMOR-1]|uniref:Alginate lyase 2 domain-containing protein n=1 Tax=Pseudoalteromonas luteoviolacea CPMOR-1 TaxID=1365248 RepID=A0A167KIA0_9GAMM|nr:hypothetical protein [Pseudoalteromonas luteoviolacea]KZN62837.1 hypothetical protein N473_18150 [Pseudoalteromonas luteoviolacea CPMOR-1]
MLNKALFTSAFIFSVSAQASISTYNLTPVVKSPFPLSYSETDKNGLDDANKKLGYLSEFSKAYVDVSKHFDTVESVCFEVDTEYSGAGSTPGMAGVSMYKYFVYSETFRGDNRASTSSGSLARPTFSKCFTESEGFAKSFIREGKIAFTPFTTDPRVTISDVRIQVSGLSKIKGDLVTLNAQLNALGAHTGEILTHAVEPNVTYSVSIIENNMTYNDKGDKYRSVGVSYINNQGEKEIKSVNDFSSEYIETQGEIELFLIGNDATSKGDVSINIKKVNID